MKKPTHWTKSESALLQALIAEDLTPAQIAKRMGRTRVAIWGRMYRTGLKSVPRRLAKLTPTEEIEVWAWYKAKRELGGYKTMAKRLGRSVQAIHSAVARMREAERDRERRTRDASLKYLADLPF